MVEVEPLTTLVVETANSIYRITILKRHALDVIVHGGPHFTERTRATLVGSSRRGYGLRVGWIGLWLHLGGGLGRRSTPMSGPGVESVRIPSGRAERVVKGAV